MSFVTIKSKIAVKPFPPPEEPKSEPKKGVSVGKLDATSKMVWLDVVAATEDSRLFPGCRVMVRGELFVQPFAKAVYRVEELEFILLPENNIEAISYPDHQNSDTVSSSVNVRFGTQP